MNTFTKSVKLRAAPMFLNHALENSVYSPFKTGKPSWKSIPRFILISKITMQILKYAKMATFLNVLSVYSVFVVACSNSDNILKIIGTTRLITMITSGAPNLRLKK